MKKRHVLGTVQISRKCNQKCVFCSAPNSNLDLSFEEAKKTIDDLKKNGVTELMFTGCSIPPCFLSGYEKSSGEILLKDTEFILERESGQRVRHVEDNKIKDEICRDCRFDTVCGGLFEGYVKLYGLEELKAVK